MTTRLHYANLAETYLREATRHRERAQYWVEQRKPDYAEGSMRKSVKWLAKATEALAEANKPATLQSTIMGTISERIAADFERMILIGR